VRGEGGEREREREREREKAIEITQVGNTLLKQVFLLSVADVFTLCFFIGFHFL
jgi:hypothetical protein